MISCNGYIYIYTAVVTVVSWMVVQVVVSSSCVALRLNERLRICVSPFSSRLIVHCLPLHSILSFRVDDAAPLVFMHNEASACHFNVASTRPDCSVGRNRNISSRRNMPYACQRRERVLSHRERIHVACCHPGNKAFVCGRVRAGEVEIWWALA